MKKTGIQNLLSSIVCIFAGLLLGFLILLLIDSQHAGESMLAIVKNFFKFSGNPQKMMYYFGSTLVKAVPVILCAQAVIFTYKSNLFNIGVAGQYMIGMVAALYSALGWNLPWYLCVLIAVLAGAAYGVLNGIFKALFNVNEVICGIMFNWIALYISNMVLSGEKTMDVGTSQTYTLADHAPNALLPQLGLNNIFGGNTHVGLALLFVIVVAVLMVIVFKKTTFGYELKATGISMGAATYSGMNPKKNTIISFAISGGIAGLAAAGFFLSGYENYQTASEVSEVGFLGIAIAFLGCQNPVGAIFAGFFVEHIMLGGQYVNYNYFSPESANLIIAIIIYLCGFSLILRDFFKKRRKKPEPSITQNANILKGGE